MSWTQLTAADGHRFDVFRAGVGGSLGHWLLLPEVFGLNDGMQAIAHARADAGYDVWMPALFDRVKPKLALHYSQLEQGRALMLQLTTEQVILDLRALLAETGCCPVEGHCWGGQWALRLAQTSQIRGAVAFYPTQIESVDSKAGAPTLIHVGSEDSHVDPETVHRWGRGVGAEVRVYPGCGHGFATRIVLSLIRSTQTAPGNVPSNGPTR